MGVTVKSWTTILNGSEFKVTRLQDAPAERTVLDNPEELVKYLERQLVASVIYRPDVENMMVIYLNVRRRAIGFEIIGTGSLDCLHVSPREIFRGAIVMNAAAIVLAHNHPSGEPTPSEADQKVTRDLIRAGQLLKIEVIDHIILGRQTIEQPKHWSSLRELGYFYA